MERHDRQTMSWVASRRTPNPQITVTKFGRYTYNRLGELAVDALGNARTEYEYHQNGQVYIVTITPDTTAPNVREVTTYYYDARGQLTSESRFDPDSIQAKVHQLRQSRPACEGRG